MYRIDILDLPSEAKARLVLLMYGLREGLIAPKYELNLPMNTELVRVGSKHKPYLDDKEMFVKVVVEFFS